MYIHRPFFNHKARYQWPVRKAQLERGRAFVVKWFRKRGVKKSLLPVIKYFLNDDKRLLKAFCQYQKIEYTWHSALLLEELFQEFWLPSFLKDVEHNTLFQSVCDDVTSIMWNDEAFHFCYEHDYLSFIRQFILCYVSEEDFEKRYDSYHLRIKEQKIQERQIEGLFSIGKQKYLPYDLCQEPWFIEAVQDLMRKVGRSEITLLRYFNVTKLIEYGDIPIPWTWYLNIRHNKFFELDYAMKDSPYHDVIKTLYNDECLTISEFAEAFRTGNITWGQKNNNEECALIL